MAEYIDREYFLIDLNCKAFGEKDVSIKWLREYVHELPAADVVERSKIEKAIEEIVDWNVNEVMDGCSEPFRRGVAKGLNIAAQILKKHIGEVTE